MFHTIILALTHHIFTYICPLHSLLPNTYTHTYKRSSNALCHRTRYTNLPCTRSILIGNAFAVPHLIICMHRCTHLPNHFELTQPYPINKRNLHFTPLFTPCSYPPHFLRTLWPLASRRIVSLLTEY